MISRWKGILNTLPEQTQLIAVSKYTHDANIETLAQAGQVDFGESKPQNLRDRAQKFPDLQWHMIGPLQKNKAKYVGKYAHMWHSCCDIEAAQAVAKHVASAPLPTLVQVNISGESKKQGVQPDELPLFLEQLSHIKELQLTGLMGMAAKDGDAHVAFKLLHRCRADILRNYPAATALCMGMSNDWRIAIEEGATMIRIGSEIFGQT
ncbi:MAG TPA: YggS family pyridoxal phosphate-dependent enzyme [Ghiorsea sp.]|nr:YggS family pyridoxal phosphate-dependent enzyme [Ghiorsea sp.]HIP07553.1 YggS family pyridoxal phosphate-dependent enzyme [Mariprofundaceae bacterium]